MAQAKNFYAQFADSAKRWAACPAVEVQRRSGVDRFSYAELRAMAERVAAFVATRGPAGAARLERGERAAILADNDARWCAAYLGVLCRGGVAVPLDTAYQAGQMAALLRDCGAKLLFVAPQYLAAAQQAAREAEASGGERCEIILLHGSSPGMADFDAILSGAATPAEAPPPCPAGADDPAVILYTSGTTSDPKGVVLTHGNLLAEKEAVFQVVRVDERDAILGALPLFHALAQMANLLLPFSVGARVVFLEALDSSELLRAMAERGITAFCCVPQFFYLIHQRVRRHVEQAGWLRRAAFRALLAINGGLRDGAGINLGPWLFRRVHRIFGRQMRLLVTGGSRFDPGIGRELYGMGISLLQAYGLTESSGAATVTRPGGKYTDSVGPPLPGVEVKILPPETPAGAENGGRDGEVLFRGPIVMPGYFRRPDANAEALAGGWLHTGDLGYLDALGQLHITGRRKEIIVLSSGKNIYPEEIEAHYLHSPYIQELCVLGLARAGEPAAERLHAVVVPNFEVMRERKVLNTREILRFEIENLSLPWPSHKRILSYEISTQALPRTTTRKLKRFEIERRVRARLAAEPAAVEPAGAPLSDADQAWAARPGVAQALEVIREAAQASSALRPDANIELELGLDSMERVELLARLQQAFGTRVPEQLAQRIYTVGELVEAVLPEGRSAAAGPARAATREDSDTWAALLNDVPEDDPELAGLLRPRPVFAAAMFAILKIVYALAWVVFRFRVAGRENLPPRGPYLICPNHQSYIDPILLASALPFSALREIFLVGASEYFATPLMRWLARRINVVPVDPDTNLLRAMHAGAFGLGHGKVLVLFPEGERSIDGAPKKFKKGAPILSLHLHAPIVPVALDGGFEVWPRGRAPQWRSLLPGGPGGVSLRFGKPLPPPAALPAGISVARAESIYAAEAEQLRATVLEMWLGLHGQPRDGGRL